MYDISLPLSLSEKLHILSDAAKYDVACTSSGVDRRGEEGKLGNSCAAGICHSFAADGRCISLLKILMSNHCIYDCKYCVNRRSNDVPRATFTPDEICTLTVEFYKRNYIEGLFLSSGIISTPEHTMEKICETLRLLRTKYCFNGYIHVKAIPGAPKELLTSAGLLADRISINMELPTEDSLSRLAPNKTFQTIFKPMSEICDTIVSHRLAIGKDARMERCGINHYLEGSIFTQAKQEDKKRGIGSSSEACIQDVRRVITNSSSSGINRPARFEKKTLSTAVSKPVKKTVADNSLLLPAEKIDAHLKRPFAPAGQSTQMIIGASGETDLQLILTSQKLYTSFDLKRVFYSGYIPINEDPALPELGTPVPLLREHRLYQADWLLRFYGFHAEELLSEERPFFNEKIDPKCNWAVQHLGDFPVEINTASHEMLLRVPGIGPKSVQKIVEARKYGSLSFETLKKIGVVLKRAQFFITCNGKMMHNTPLEEKFITGCLVDNEKNDLFAGSLISESTINSLHDNAGYTSFRQLDLFSALNSFGKASAV